VLEQRDLVDHDEDDGLVDEPGPDDPREIRDDGTLGTAAVVPAVPPDTAVAARTRRRLTWGQGLILIAGVTSLVFGIGAIALAGLAGSITEPVVRVFTFDHTPLLGVIEVGVGVVLIVAALVPGGAIAGGALILAEYPWTQTELAAEQDFGWVAIAVGAAAYIGAMVAPRRRSVAA
jgi:uncharacterized membrane protein YdbT with pleckstrin-like domain